ncbi:unnamed protein product [Angiostrongylus costaricensis]|uniref:Saposin B-type domain-containing protein n=1 Tax=Angiostrongylus costaricensis TaxID=334426 RepID=A0A0R3Q1X4_ANGCS|nr:unnamed protein product [Angiostrongylus costaricensis]
MDVFTMHVMTGITTTMLSAVSEFCRDDVPEFLSDYCEKIIAKNLKYIIEKLKDHEPADKICADLYLCNE